MAIKLVITIDTEEDTWSDWQAADNPVNNVSYIPVLQNIFDRYGALATYLINYPVVMDPIARRTIKEIYNSGRCAIGAHCHPWNTPPFEEKITPYNSMLCNLSHELQFKKITTLHEEIVDKMGIVPISFRAGRWAFSPSVARFIYKLGYKVDTSVTPFIDWTYEHGPDFSDAPEFPYRFDPERVLSDDSNGKLLEISPTIGFLQANFERCARIRKWIRKGPVSRFRILGGLDRFKLLNLRWLSPELCNGSEMIKLARNFIRMGNPIVNMSFHSTSLLPGKGPFVRNDDDLQRFLKKIERFLEFAAENNFNFSSLCSAL